MKRGDTVALMLVNRPEFNLVDMAALHLGAIPFSVYNSSSAEQIEYLFSNAENTVAITEARFLETVRKAGPQLKHIVCIDGGRRGHALARRADGPWRGGLRLRGRVARGAAG